MRATSSAADRDEAAVEGSNNRVAPGRHPRAHAANVLRQQARFDAFLDCYNQERPHRALDMKVPAEAV